MRPRQRKKVSRFLPCRRAPDLARELTAAGRIACLDGSDSNGEGSGSEGIVCAGGSRLAELGRHGRILSKSHFIDYMSLASFASDEYPGPTQHYCVACEDHILNVLSTEAPTVKRLL